MASMAYGQAAPGHRAAHSEVVVVGVIESTPTVPEQASALRPGGSSDVPRLRRPAQAASRVSA